MAGITDRDHDHVRPSLADIIEWDVRNWGVALEFWSAWHAESLGGQKVLAVGEKNGGLSLHFAWLGADVVCTDVHGPSDLARARHRSYRLDSRIACGEASVMDLPYPDDTFNIVTFKSVIGYIEDPKMQQKAFDEIRRVLKPSGVLLFAENAVGSILHRCLRRLFAEDWERWKYRTIDDLRELTSGFSDVDLRAYGFFSVFGRAEWLKSVLHLVDDALDRVIPASSKYIVFGVAKK